MLFSNFWNKHFIPLSTDEKIIIPADGSNWFNGISDHYKSEFPIELQRIITRKEFTKIMININSICKNFWPCVPAQVCGYMFCPFTLGFSQFVPTVCIFELQDEIANQINELNTNFLEKSGYEIKLKKIICFTSWFEITKLKEVEKVVIIEKSYEESTTNTNNMKNDKVRYNFYSPRDLKNDNNNNNSKDFKKMNNITISSQSELNNYSTILDTQQSTSREIENT